MLKRQILAVAMTCIAAAVHAEVDLSGCKPLLRSGVFPFDYNNAELRSKHLRTVTDIHFTPNVEKLVRGATSTHPYGDIAYTLNHIPNFPRALQALQRLAARPDTVDPRFRRASPDVACHFKQAINIAPNDIVPRMIFAQYYVSLEKPDLALEQLRDAETIAPNDPNLAYNIGLLLADKKQYDKAQAYADIAYLGGFPLPGLRDKLKRAGAWREPVPVPAAEEASKPAVAAQDEAGNASSPSPAVAAPVPVDPGQKNEPAAKP